MFIIRDTDVHNIFHTNYSCFSGERVLDVLSRDLALVVKSLRKGVENCPLPPGWTVYEHASGISAQYEAEPEVRHDRYMVPVVDKREDAIYISAFLRYLPWECIWCGHDRRWDDFQECPSCGGC